MSEPQQPAADQQQTPEAAQPDAAQQPETGQPDDYRGAGSKDALKADLAAERDKRQALESQFSQLRDGLAKALGIESEKATPEQLTEQLTASRTETAAANARLAVFLAAPEGVDVKALLDSASFSQSLSKIDVSDPQALASGISEFVTNNPRFRTVPTGAGSRDATAGGGAQPSTRTMDDFIRGN